MTDEQQLEFHLRAIERILRRVTAAPPAGAGAINFTAASAPCADMGPPAGFEPASLSATQGPCGHTDPAGVETESAHPFASGGDAHAHDELATSNLV